MSRLRVGMLAPISWRVPPRHYGPWERFVSLLTEGLVARGVDVTLFASADSVTSARLVGTIPTGYSEDPELDVKVWECLHIASLFERAGEFDVIHNNADFLPLAWSALVDTPVLTTIHGFSSARIVPVYERYDPSTWYVAISEADRHPRLSYVGTVHHGVDTGELPLSLEPEGYLLAFGRVHPDKGTGAAIRVARRAGLPLVIAGIVHDDEYFRAEVEPHVDGRHVRYLGSVGPRERAEVLGGAAALLHLVGFDEPFGLSVVEAMSCGTPVVAYRRGALPELITPGVNGALVDDEDGAVTAIAEVLELDRREVRADVDRRFTVDRMVDDYLAVYERVRSEHRARLIAPSHPSPNAGG